MKPVKIIHAQVNAFTREIPGVRASADSESLHRMRVASRRLRTSLYLFGELFPQDQHDFFVKTVRRIARVLGRPRDIDTEIDFLKELLSGEKNETRRNSLRLAVDRLARERRRLQPAVARALDDLKDQDLPRRFRDALGGSLSPSEKKVIARLKKRTLKQLRKMLGFEHAVHQPRRVSELHQLRIAAKHLRYSLEVLAKFRPREFAPFIRQARLIQKHLGDMHNYYAWKGFEKEYKRLQKISYVHFVNAWTRQKDRRLWKDLLKKLR